mmetsp:Transcript_4074/g.7145  ORF Transcript_4074/g.7145 Transcript_4074/m.7145 type:complete len:415 (-) Transcript_4074:1172-2416(-)
MMLSKFSVLISVGCQNGVRRTKWKHNFSTMRGIVKTHPGAGLELVDNLPIPVIKPDEVLIRTLKTSICGTDTHLYQWNSWAEKMLDNVPLPLTLGHEFIGQIEEIGSEALSAKYSSANDKLLHKIPLKIGTRVTAEGHISHCDHHKACISCRNGLPHLCNSMSSIGITRAGAFADFVSVPISNLITLPLPFQTELLAKQRSGLSDGVDLLDWTDIGALLDPLGNALHSILAAGPVENKRVLITGSGPVGIMSAIVCQELDAKQVVITDVNSERIKLAQKCGIQDTVQVPNNRAFLEDFDFDVGLEMSGSGEGLQTLIEKLRSGGKLALLGIPSRKVEFDAALVVTKGIQMQGIYGRQMYDTWNHMLTMLQNGLASRLVPLITHRYPAENFQEGFQAMQSGKAGKVILQWVASSS